MADEKKKTLITVSVEIDCPINMVWEYWTKPEHVIHWNFASNDWHCPSASNDLVEGGSFSYRMEAKDGSVAFDFEGTYDRIVPLKEISYTIADGRRVKVTFTKTLGATELFELFEAEDIHSPDLQRQGWQAILHNFKQYVISSIQ